MLNGYKFSIDLQSKSLLEENDFTNVFKQFIGNMGKSKITISADAEKEENLDNLALIKFFKLGKESGFLKTAKLRKKGGHKLVDSLSKGDYLTYSNNNKIENLEGANNCFLNAFEDKEEIIQEKKNKL